jgi:hypothetical protein
MPSSDDARISTGDNMPQKKFTLAIFVLSVISAIILPAYTVNIYYAIISKTDLLMTPIFPSEEEIVSAA